MTIAAAAVALVPALLGAPTATASSAVGTAPTSTAERTDSTTERVATMRDRVVTLVNNRRVARGCNRLRAVDSLDRAAQQHSRRMASAQKLSHQLPGEPGLGTRFTRAGYRGWTLIGENIASHYTTARSVVRAWMHSPPHRRNILKCRFKHTGVGLAWSTAGVPYWTQDFGRR